LLTTRSQIVISLLTIGEYTQRTTGTRTINSNKQ
jgi:hypothetical protein